MTTSPTPPLDGPHCADCTVGRLLHDTAAPQGRAFAFGAVLLVSVFAAGCSFSFQNQLGRQQTLALNCLKTGPNCVFRRKVTEVSDG